MNKKQKRHQKEKKEADIFSDKEEIMPKKSTETSSTDQIAGMMDKVKLDKQPAPGAGRGSSPMRRPGAPPPPSPGKGHGQANKGSTGSAAPKDKDDATRQLRHKEQQIKGYRSGYQHSLMKFESTSAKLDLLRDVQRRQYSPPMAIKVERILTELETLIDNMEN